MYKLINSRWFQRGSGFILYFLGDNSTAKISLSRNGLIIRETNTYGTPDILIFARAWTGFFYSRRRSNFQDIDHSGHTRVDFMEIPRGSEGNRDWNLKRSLAGGFIGDPF